MPVCLCSRSVCLSVLMSLMNFINFSICIVLADKAVAGRKFEILLFKDPLKLIKSKVVRQIV